MPLNLATKMKLAFVFRTLLAVSVFVWPSASALADGLPVRTTAVDFNSTIIGLNAGDPTGAARFAKGVAAGDVNGDGNPDLAIGMPDLDSVYIRLLDANQQVIGGITIPDPDPRPDQQNAFGFSLAFVDITADGVPELLIGSPGYVYPGAPADHFNHGAVYLVTFTDTATLAHTIVLTQSPLNNPFTVNDHRYGYDLSSVGGDLNLDGYPDVFVSAPANLQRVYILSFRPDGTLPDITVDNVITTSRLGVTLAGNVLNFGQSVTMLDDWDGDPTTVDFAVGVPGAQRPDQPQNINTGAVLFGHIRPGNPPQIIASRTSRVFGVSHDPDAGPAYRFGDSVAATWDQDGNGFNDIIVRHGEGYMVLGRPNPPRTGSSGTIEGTLLPILRNENQPTTAISDVTDLGDVDGDGVRDNAFFFPFLSGNPGITGLVRIEYNHRLDDAVLSTLEPTPLFVDADAVAGSNDGTSWANAFTDLQNALAAAPEPGVLLVAEGTYSPGGAATDTFALRRNVALLGGFDGTETGPADRTRDPLDHPTILNGAGVSYHVVTGSGAGRTALLDGFTITGGVANGPTGDGHHLGAGIVVDDASTRFLFRGSPVFRHLHVTGNSATAGGGIYINLARPSILNSRFTGNSASNGGAIYVNDADRPVLTNLLLADNTATSAGGGLYTTSGTHLATNLTLTANTAPNASAVRVNSGTLAIRNSIVWNNTGAAQQITGAATLTNTLTADPLLDGAFVPQLGSPAINTGDNSFNFQPCDAAGGARIVAVTIDLGAFENEVNPIFIDADAAGASSGASWVDAFSDLQTALGLAVAGHELWIAAGEYSPGPARADTFALKNGVAIYGGFSGGEDTRDQRDPNPLSNGTSLDGSAADNFHVVTATGTEASALLDGFTITGGLANGSAANRQHVGGGITIDGSGAPTLRNLNIAGNTAVAGGGLYANLAAPAIVNSRFVANHATDGGGGTYLNDSAGSTLTNLLFASNSAIVRAGGLFTNAGTLTATNLTFTGNNAPSESAIRIHSGALILRNSIVWNNTGAAQQIGPGALAGGSSNNLIAIDPLLDAAFVPQLGSPAIDAGGNPFNPEPLDLAGAPRIINRLIDIGAFESPFVTFAGQFPGLDPEDDANANGLTNYQDYAAGFDPTAPQLAGNAPTLFFQNGDLIFQSTVRINASDVHTSTEGSPDLHFWQTLQAGIDFEEIAVISQTPNRVQIQLRLLFAEPAPSRYFLRRRFSATPMP